MGKCIRCGHDGEGTGYCETCISFFKSQEQYHQEALDWYCSLSPEEREDYDEQVAQELREVDAKRVAVLNSRPHYVNAYQIMYNRELEDFDF